MTEKNLADASTIFDLSPLRNKTLKDRFDAGLLRLYNDEDYEQQYDIDIKSNQWNQGYNGNQKN